MIHNLWRGRVKYYHTSNITQLVDNLVSVGPTRTNFTRGVYSSVCPRNNRHPWKSQTAINQLQHQPKSFINNCNKHVKYLHDRKDTSPIQQKMQHTHHHESHLILIPNLTSREAHPSQSDCSVGGRWEAQFYPLPLIYPSVFSEEVLKCHS